MICHVCKAQASGQCTKCLRFYCPEHGDAICVACRGSSGRGDDAPVASAAEGDLASTSAGPTCYVCSSRAAHACGLCGRFCCPDHFVPGWCSTALSVCKDCFRKASERERVGCLIALLVMAIMFVFFLAHIYK